MLRHKPKLNFSAGAVIYSGIKKINSEEDKKILSSSIIQNETQAKPSSVKVLRVLLPAEETKMNQTNLYSESKKLSPKMSPNKTLPTFKIVDPVKDKEAPSLKLHQTLALLAGSLTRMNLNKGKRELVSLFSNHANNKFIEVIRFLDSGMDLNKEDRENNKPIDSFINALPKNSIDNIQIVDEIVKNIPHFPKELALITVKYLMSFTEECIFNMLNLLHKHGSIITAEHCELLKTQGYESCVNMLEELMLDNSSNIMPMMRL